MKQQAQSLLLNSTDLKQPKVSYVMDAAALRASVSGVVVSHQLGRTNQERMSRLLVERIRALGSSSTLSLSQEWSVQQVPRGQAFVKSGRLALSLSLDHGFAYSHVPLGFVLKGEVSVMKGGKATKTLHAGDFVGLFETADWLAHGQNREIGDWCLTAHRDSEILFLSESVLRGQSSEQLQFAEYLMDLSRRDPVPQPISHLPILDWIASQTTSSRLKDYAIIAHTHLLPNNVPFFRHLSHLVSFGQIYVLEKPYSTVPSAYRELVQSGIEVVNVKMEAGMPYEYAARKSTDLLWARVIEDQKKHGFKKLLVVDDGGDLWLSIPWQALEGVQIAGVEQTQRGITRIRKSHLRTPPIVSVASSGIKKTVESVFIGDAVVRKIQELGLIRSDKRIGILGTGSIGQAVVQGLRRLNCDPLFYDPAVPVGKCEDEGLQSSIDVLLNESDIIIGTTGTDTLKGVALERVQGHKILVSASSADVEFGSLLRFASETSNLFGVREVQVHAGFSVEILNGGYPMNFDRLQDATPSEDIVLTRSLMYVGAMQAIQLIESGNLTSGLYGIDIVAQKELMKRWVHSKKQLGQLVPAQALDIESVVASGDEAGFLSMPSVWKGRRE